MCESGAGGVSGCCPSGSKEGCVMSPWLFNIYTDGIVREMYARAEGNGVNLVGVDGQEWELC